MEPRRGASVAAAPAVGGGEPCPTTATVAVRGLRAAHDIVRRWLDNSDLPDEVRPLLDTPMMTGGAYAYLVTRHVLTGRTPSVAAVHLAVIAELQLLLPECSSILVGRSDLPRIGLANTFRSQARAYRGLVKHLIDSDLDTARGFDEMLRAQRRGCELLLRHNEGAPQDGPTDEGDEPLVALFRHVLGTSASAAASHDDALVPFARTFGEGLGEFIARTLRARHMMREGSPEWRHHEARAQQLAAEITFVGPYADEPVVMAGIGAFRGSVANGVWDGLFTCEASARWSKALVEPRVPKRDATRASIAAILRGHYRLEGSDIARDIAQVYGEPQGKLLRGLLTVLFARMSGASDSEALAVGAAIELVHAGSLVVDDVVDASSTRHGLPTVGERYGPIVALALGQHLWSSALTLLKDRRSLKRLVIRTVCLMLDGQRRELRGSSDPVRLGTRLGVTRRRYLRQIDLKTASLFATACVAGTILGNRRFSSRNAAATFGRALGRAFQITDDALDYFGSETLGKSIGLDFCEGVVTLPLLLLAERSAADHALVIELIHATERERRERFSKVRARMIEASVPEEVKTLAQRYVDEALSALDVFPDSAAKRQAAEHCSWIVDRDS